MTKVYLIMVDFPHPITGEIERDIIDVAFFSFEEARERAHNLNKAFADKNFYYFTKEIEVQ